jgi:hypothetical protein
MVEQVAYTVAVVALVDQAVLGLLMQVGLGRKV